jgi:cytochrome b561
VNLETAISQLHKYLAYVMLAVAAVHVAAVVKHRIARHDVLDRMSFK